MAIFTAGVVGAAPVKATEALRLVREVPDGVEVWMFVSCPICGQMLPLTLEPETEQDLQGMKYLPPYRTWLVGGFVESSEGPVYRVTSNRIVTIPKEGNHHAHVRVLQLESVESSDVAPLLLRVSEVEDQVADMRLIRFHW